MPVARIEAPEAELTRLVEPGVRGMIVAKLKELGYTYVTLDLAGFRSGSLNDVLGSIAEDRRAGEQNVRE
jgi:uncharacterized protein